VTVGVYDRALPGQRPNLYIRYTITEELRIKHGLTARKVREPTGLGDKRAAAALRSQRLREVKAGTWRPLVDGSTSGLTVRARAADHITKRKADGVITAGDEDQRLRDYVLPVIGDRPLESVQRPDIAALMAKVQREPSKHTGEPHAARTIHRIYEAVRILFNEAVLDGLLIASPCTLRIKRGELPPKRDKDPNWRARAIFTREEVEILISDLRIPQRRRVLYGLAFLGAMRLGEVTGRRFRDYDRAPRPLGCLVVSTQYDDLALKGERPTRSVPVHTVLAKLLAEWELNGFALNFGRRPTADDFIVPKRSVGRTIGFTPGAQRQQNVWRNLQIDLEKVGLRPRRVHDTRRTFITLAKADGADKYLLRWVTHGPPSEDAFDDYNSPPWETLCEQVAKLRIGLRGAAEVVPIARKKGRDTHASR